MTESQFTQRLLRAFRRRMPGAVVVKLNDRFTAGLPDFYIVHNGHTTWWEVKLTKKNTLRTLQTETLRKHQGAYIFWDRGTKKVSVWYPHNDFTIKGWSFEEFVDWIWVSS
jgi:hypothetical protein